MRDAAAFEALLERSLAVHAQRADRPFDPGAIAHVAAMGDRTAAERAFGALGLRRQLLLVGIVTLLAVGLAIAGARLLEPKPLGWGTTFYLLSDRGLRGDTGGGPFLLSVSVGTDEEATLRVELDAATRGLPAGLQLESMSPSGRYALLTTHQGRPVEEPGTRAVVDTADGSVDLLPPSLGAAWGPSGDRLAWWGGVPSDMRVAVFDADRGVSRQLDGAGGNVEAVLWLDAENLVMTEWHSVPCTDSLLACMPVGDGMFERSTSSTWVVPVDGGAATRVDRPGTIAGWRGGPFSLTSLSPDRSLVAYLVEDFAQLESPALPRATTVTVWVHDPDGANARPLATFTRPVDGPFAPIEFDQAVWSADSRTFSWAVLGRLWVARADATIVTHYDLPKALQDPAVVGESPSFTWRLP